jgi:hypothetical protein
MPDPGPPQHTRRRVDARPLDARRVDARPLDARRVDARALDARRVDARALDARRWARGQRLRCGAMRRNGTAAQGPRRGMNARLLSPATAGIRPATATTGDGTPAAATGDGMAGPPRGDGTAAAATTTSGPHTAPPVTCTPHRLRTRTPHRLSPARRTVCAPARRAPCHLHAVPSAHPHAAPPPPARRAPPSPPRNPATFRGVFFGEAPGGGHEGATTRIVRLLCALCRH